MSELEEILKAGEERDAEWTRREDAYLEAKSARHPMAWLKPLPPTGPMLAELSRLRAAVRVACAEIIAMQPGASRSLAESHLESVLAALKGER